jgi:hypothetical protein
MGKSIKYKQKKLGRGMPPTGQDRMVGARLPDDTISAIDLWAEAESLSRSEAIRRLVEIGLKVKSQ